MAGALSFRSLEEVRFYFFFFFLHFLAAAEALLPFFFFFLHFFFFFGGGGVVGVVAGGSGGGGTNDGCTTPFDSHRPPGPLVAAVDQAAAGTGARRQGWPSRR